MSKRIVTIMSISALALATASGPAAASLIDLRLSSDSAGETEADADGLWDRISRFAGERIAQTVNLLQANASTDAADGAADGTKKETCTKRDARKDPEEQKTAEAKDENAASLPLFFF